MTSGRPTIGLVTSEAIVFPLEEQPRLRPVEAFPVQDGAQRYIMLRDPSDPSVSPLVLADGAVEFLALLDGTRSLDGIHAALQLRGAPISRNDVRLFLERLDAAGYLEGPRARHRLEQRRAQFRARPARVAVHAGGAYPDGLAELPQFLAAGYLHPDGPGALPGPRDPTAPPLRGVVAPHVDLHRGAPTYSWAYKALAEVRPAELYVVLGTCHTPVEGSFAATRKPYDTPLGAVPSDVAFLERLSGLWGRDLCAGEFSHAAEHSIEFQAVYLRSLGLAGEGAAPMAAILCDSLHGLVLPPHSPRDVAVVADFVAALRQAIAEDGRRVTVIAAVDLAHVGPRFGDRGRVGEARLAAVRRADLETLELVAAGDAEGYFRQVMRDDDARRICGLTPLYLLAEMMGGEQRHGQLLRYTQWAAPDGSASVTFASLVFR
jgi:AmmeMemoRadiSam system protein B